MSEAPTPPGRPADTVNSSGSLTGLLGLFVIACAEGQRLWPSGTSLIYLAISLPLLLIWIAHLAGWRLAERHAGLAIDISIYILVVASLGIRFGSQRPGSELASTLLFWSPLVAAWWAWRYRYLPLKLWLLLGGFFVGLTWQLASEHERFHQHLILSVLVALVVRHAYRRPPPEGAGPTINLRDPLTGLPSPECFEAELAHVAAISDRYRFPLSLIGCRIARPGPASQFDRLLCKCADAIVDRLRAADTACHWNATTFLLLLPNTGEQEAGIVANGIQETIRRLDFDQNSPLTVAIRVIRHQPDEDPMSTVSALENALAKTVE